MCIKIYSKSYHKIIFDFGILIYQSIIIALQPRSSPDLSSFLFVSFLLYVIIPSIPNIFPSVRGILSLQRFCVSYVCVFSGRAFSVHARPIVVFKII